MATSTRAQLATRVIANTGRSDKTTLTTEALNEVLIKLGRIHPFDEIRLTASTTLTAGTSSLTLPTNLHQIVEVRFTDPAVPTAGYPIQLVRKTNFLIDFPNVSGQPTTGMPTVCYRELGTLYFNIKATSNYTILMTYVALNRYTADGDASLIPDSDECLIAGATAYVYESMQMYDDARYWWGKFSAEAKLLSLASQREIGITPVPRPYSTSSSPSGPAPWLDPFAGVDE